MASWEAAGKSDDWYTPAYIFEALGCTFDLDVAAPVNGPRHVPCKGWRSEASLQMPWHGFVWMNPPYGGRNGLRPWLQKFITHGNGIAVTPDRTSAPWFQEAARQMDAVLFISPKVQFERPDGSAGKSPGCGTALHAIGGQGVAALRMAADKLGLLMVNFRHSRTSGNV